MTTAELFSQGLRGVGTAYTVGASRGIALQGTFGSTEAALLVDTAHRTKMFLKHKGERGSVGLTHQANAFSGFAQGHHRHYRAFTEVASNGNADLGMNATFHDLLFETTFKRRDQTAYVECYLSWRDPLGQWNVRRVKNRWFLQWQNRRWLYTVSQHRPADEAAHPTYRHK